MILRYFETLHKSLFSIISTYFVIYGIMKFYYTKKCPKLIQIHWSNYLISIVDLHSFVLKKILQSDEIIIRDVGWEWSVTKRYHRVRPMQCLWKKCKKTILEDSGDTKSKSIKYNKNFTPWERKFFFHRTLTRFIVICTE